MGSPGGEKVFSVSLLVQTMLRVSLFLTNEVENKQVSGAPEPNPAIPTNTSILIFSVNFRNFSIQKPGDHSQTRQENSLLAAVPFYQRRIGVGYMHSTGNHIFPVILLDQFFLQVFYRSSVVSEQFWVMIYITKTSWLVYSEGHVELRVPGSR